LRGCTRSGSKDIAPSGTNWKANPTTTRTCRPRWGSAGTTKGTSLAVDDFVAAQCLQLQQGSTSFNTLAPSH
jgi:hypothetical protein